MAETSGFQMSQDIEVLGFRRLQVCLVAVDEWSRLKKRVLALEERGPINRAIAFRSGGSLLVGAALSTLISLFAGSFPTHEARVAAIAAVVVTAICGAVLFYAGVGEQNQEKLSAAHVGELMELIEARFSRTSEEARQSTRPPLEPGRAEERDGDQVGQDKVPQSTEGEPQPVSSRTRHPALWLLFRGGYVVLPHSPDLEPDDITLEAWVCALANGHRNACVVRKAGDQQPGYILRWRQDDTEPPHFRLDRRSEPTIVVIDSSLPDLTGRWVHLAGTYDSLTGTACFFVDGTLRARGQTYPGPMHYSHDHLTIGSSPNAEGESFGGVIRAVRICSTVIYRENFRPAWEYPDEPSAVVLLPLEEGSGVQVRDAVAGRVGTLTGNVQWVESAAVDGLLGRSAP